MRERPQERKISPELQQGKKAKDRKTIGKNKGSALKKKGLRSIFIRDGNPRRKKQSNEPKQSWRFSRRKEEASLLSEER